MNSESAHRLRLSIDIRAIKDHDFLAQLYVKYNALPDLGIKPFRSSPTLQINNQKVEIAIPNGFASYLFDSNAESLKSRMDKILDLEVWHSDRLKKDVMLGKARIEIKALLSEALRKTRQSYARVYDAYIPVDEYDESDHPVRKIGALRTIVYLEDLGPVSQLAEREQKLGISPQIQISEPRNLLPPGLPSESGPVITQADRQRQTQLNELEYKVVWQLQTWKKAQEAKTKILLKQREVQFWSNLAQQQKKQDLEKQKYFRKIQANLTLIEGKLKAKGGELKKREEKIVMQEQQLQTKIIQVSKQLHSKDEEIDTLRKKMKEDKTNMAKEKASLEIQVQRLKSQISKIKIDFEQANKQDEKSPLFVIKTELNNKIYEIRDLTKQLEKAIETKDQYKAYYEKMRQEVVRLKADNQKKQETADSMKYENESLKANIKLLQQQLAMVHQQQQQYYYPAPRDDYRSDNNQDPTAIMGGGSKLDALRRERQDLLDGGAYGPNDPLIKQYDKMITDLMNGAQQY